MRALAIYSRDRRGTPALAARLASLEALDRLRHLIWVNIVELHDTVVRDLTCPDPACEVTIAAFARRDAGEIEIGAASYVIRPDGLHCDCTVTVDPDWQKLGVGRALMKRLIDIARTHGIRRMYATTEHHAGAHALGEHLGFHARPDPEDPLVTTYELELQ